MGTFAMLSALSLASAPLYVALLAVEVAWARRRGRADHDLRETVGSLACGAVEQAGALVVTVPLLAVYAAVAERSVQLPVDSAWTWLVAGVVMDLLYYGYHRASHEVGFIWALHVVHHQSRDFNVAVALRNAALGKVVQLGFTLPLALMGVPVVVLVVLKTLMNVYMFAQHTQAVGRLGWLEGILVTPSSHRVHHALNARYVDHNYGGILAVWDRLFGTHQEEDEDEPCVFDAVPDHPGYDPLRANWIGWAGLWRSVRAARSASEALSVVFGPPVVDYAGASAVRPVARPATGLDVYAYAQMAAAVAGLALPLGFAGGYGAWPAAGWVIAGLVAPNALLDRRRWAVGAEAVRLGLGFAGLAASALVAEPSAGAVAGLAWCAGSAAVLAAWVQSDGVGVGVGAEVRDEA